MRWSTFFLIVVVAASGYYLWTQWDRPPPAAAPAPIAPSKSLLTCPACGGEGQIMLVRGHAKTDKPYACPICGGQGYLNRTPPPGALICPDCKGMGKRLYNSHSQRFVGCPPSEVEKAVRLHGAPCKRCNSTGYLQVPPAR